MKTTDLVLLPETTYGTASGNYDGSSQDWSGDRQPAANYYLRNSSVQTVAYQLSGFSGSINIQATLDTDPSGDSDWFTVLSITSSTANSSQSVTGNFTWLRANVTDFSAGTITSITLSY